MATKTKTEVTAPVKDEITPEQWQQVLDGLKAGTGGKFFFLKNGQTRLRLYLPEGRDPFAFYSEVVNGYGKTRYLVLAQVMGATDREIPEAARERIMPVIIPKTALNGILNLLVDGFDLFSAKGGYGISIRRSGEGFGTEYSVNPSKGSQAIDPDLEVPTETIEELAAAFTEESAKRQAQGNQQNGSGKGGHEAEEGGDW